MYVLDTCVFSPYYVRENPKPPLKEKIESTPYEELWITAITVEETIQGALRLIREIDNQKLEKQRELPAAYDLLVKVTYALNKPQILPFDKAAFDVYKTIPEKVRKGKTRDCRIAAITVSRGRPFTLVTHNEDDFRDIKRNALPQLDFVNW